MPTFTRLVEVHGSATSATVTTPANKTTESVVLTLMSANGRQRFTADCRMCGGLLDRK